MPTKKHYVWITIPRVEYDNLVRVTGRRGLGAYLVEKTELYLRDIYLRRIQDPDHYEVAACQNDTG